MQRDNDSNKRDFRGGRRMFMRGAIIGSAAALIVPTRFLQAGNGGPFDCLPTSSDVEGPFYRGNAPFRVALAGPEEPGERLEISGTVFAKDCTTPLAGVTVDVWAANEAGCYYTFQGCTPSNEDFYNLRGRLLTDANGAYAFSTILPGRYPNAGTLRPRHVHFRVTAPGRTPLITQLYFEGDEFIPEDPFASEPDAAPRIIPLALNNGVHTGKFDITLNISAPTTGVETHDAGSVRTALLLCQPNPFRESARIDYVVAAAGRIHLSIHDMHGRKVRTVADSVHAAGRYGDTWDGMDDAGKRLPAGVYACRLQQGSSVQSMKLLLAE